MNKTLIALLTAGLVPVALAANDPLEASAEPVTYSFAEEAELHHVRFPDTDGGNFGLEKNGVGINWTDGSGFYNLTDVNASWLRLVLNAETSGQYVIPITYNAGDYPLRVYVNSATNLTEFNDLSAGWALSDYDLALTLEEGENVVIIQMRDWGSIRTFELPEGLSLVQTPSEDGVYGKEELIYQATYLQGINDETAMFDPDSEVYYGDLAYDTDHQFEGAAIAYITPDEDNVSLDVTVKLTQKTSTGNASLGFAVGGSNAANPAIIDLSDLEVGVETTVHLPSYELANMGYAVNRENYVRITNRTSGSTLQVIDIRESAQVDADPSIGKKEISADELKDMVSIRGRSIDVAGEIPLDWSASGLDFIFNGSGDIILELDIESNTQNTFFTVDIDGSISQVAASARTTIASGIEDGEHHISIYKSSEAAGNLMSVISMQIDEEATVSKPAEKSLKFEFIGDSLTCANQVAANLEDAYQGFARRLASAYDADFDVISVSGRGLMEGYNSESGWIASKDNQMKDIWDYESYFRDISVSRVEGEEPDVVVAGLGSNDLGEAIMTSLGTSIDDFTAEVATFTEKLRSAYPNAKIIWAYGSFINRDYIEEYSAAVEAIGDENVAFVEFPQMMLGDSGHMNELNHDEAASILSKQISEMLGMEDPYVREYEYETYEAEDAFIDGGSVTPNDPGCFWSGEAYVGSFSDKADPARSVEEIEDDMSNISYVRFDVEVDDPANYELRIGLATSTTAVYGIKVDSDPWQKMSFTGTDWAGGHGVYQSIEDVPLAAGTHSIYITSALNEGGWVNYDYLVLVKGEELTAHSITATEGTGYAITDLTETVIDGQNATFRVELEDNYSKSEIGVYANDELVTPDDDGLYTVSNVTEDIVLTVEGVELNRWTVYFYGERGDDEPFAETEVEVGGEIVAPEETPTKEGYTFKGWDISFDEMPNSDINVYAIWEEGSSSNPDGGGNEPDEGGVNIPLIVGCSVGGVAAAGLIAGGVIFFLKRKKH